MKEEESQLTPGQDESRASDELTKQRQAEERLKKSVRLEPAVKKIVKQAARLADMITDDDRVKAKTVIREAMDATCWRSDGSGKSSRIVVEPDHKTRLAASTLQLAYDEGLPVKRSIVLTGDFKTSDEFAKMIEGSPEAARAIQTLAGLGIGIENEGEIIDVEATGKSCHTDDQDE